MIEYFSENIDFELDNKEIISQWIEKIVGNHHFMMGDMSIVFCSDDYLLEMNKEHLNHNYYTDIITFDYVENKILSGDIFISIDRVKMNAQEYEVTFENELYRVIIHGVLHLLGFKDKTEEEQEVMTKKEDESLLLFDE